LVKARQSSHKWEKKEQKPFGAGGLGREKKLRFVNRLKNKKLPFGKAQIINA